jgi:hypothetical protein
MKEVKIVPTIDCFEVSLVDKPAIGESFLIIRQAQDVSAEERQNMDEVILETTETPIVSEEVVTENTALVVDVAEPVVENIILESETTEAETQVVEEITVADTIEEVSATEAEVTPAPQVEDLSGVVTLVTEGFNSITGVLSGLQEKINVLFETVGNLQKITIPEPVIVRIETDETEGVPDVAEEVPVVEKEQTSNDIQRKSPVSATVVEEDNKPDTVISKHDISAKIGDSQKVLRRQLSDALERAYRVNG